MMPNMNADPLELQKFSELAHRWWDPASDFKPLHEINPLRLDYIDRIAGLSGKTVLDVGLADAVLLDNVLAARRARMAAPAGPDAHEVTAAN